MRAVPVARTCEPSQVLLGEVRGWPAPGANGPSMGFCSSQCTRCHDRAVPAGEPAVAASSHPSGRVMCPWCVSGRFCRSCIATSLKSSKWTCPYCRAYLPSEGVPATDVTRRMKSEFQNCSECGTRVSGPVLAGCRAEKSGTGLLGSPVPFDLPSPGFLKVMVSAFLQFHRCERQENSHRMPTIASFSTQTLSLTASISSLPMAPLPPWDVASIPAPLLQAATRALLANPVAHLHPRP